VITLRAMRFHPRVGVLAHEADFPQPLEVDLTVWLSAPEGGPADVMDYRELYELTLGVISAEPLRYLETVADEVARRALARPRVIGARVAVRKPHVALPGPLAYAEVRVERGRRG
jgi:dihydroneopterin aldolase